MGFDFTDLLSLQFELSSEFNLDETHALYGIDHAGAATELPVGSYYVEENMETGEVEFRLLEEGLTFEQIKSFVGMGYRSETATDYTYYGNLTFVRSKQGMFREWKRVGSPVMPWEVPVVEGAGYISGWPFWFTALGEEAA